MSQQEIKTLILGKILWPNGDISKGYIVCSDGIIIQASHGSISFQDENIKNRLELEDNQVIVPGLIDLQLNGGFGYEMRTNPEGVNVIAEGLPQFGVTSFMPAVTTSPFEKYPQLFGEIENSAKKVKKGANILGVHVEGPYLNPEKAGAHKKDYLRLPNLTDIQMFIDSKNIRMITLSPELPGALDLIEKLCEYGYTVGIGHSSATYSQTISAIERGARWGVHLFNGMGPFTHQEPGMVGALLTDSRVKFGLVADGVHVHPTALKIAYAAKGPDGIVLTTDGSAVTGLPKGEYTFGDRIIISDGVAARLPTGNLCGSLLTPDKAIRNMIELGVKFSDAIFMSSANPADLIGLSNKKGKIAAGFDADLVVLDMSNYKVLKTIVAGEVVFDNLV